RASDLLSKLNDFSNEKEPSRERTDINALLMDIVTLTRESFLRHADVKLHTDLDKELPTITAEKAGLKQVFINLIKNAVEAMEAGGNLFIQTRRLPPPISGKPAPGKKGPHGYVEIQFKDDGPGIPEDIKEKLFDPYVSSKEGGHSGLGLSIAYHIIKSLHGHIVCEHVPDQGTMFKVELPIQGVFNRQK
uniref:two-component system sensor histidine kinase NtrB n=1 Tax=Desulfosarcina sp. TaxID=2027861 RepID=UPI003567380B